MIPYLERLLDITMKINNTIPDDCKNLEWFTFKKGEINP